VSDREIGVWLRKQREARSWARPEMARRLISAARSRGDTSTPAAETLTRYIIRWESGATAPTERYKLYYCQAFMISRADFGAADVSSAGYRFSIPAHVAVAAVDLMADFLDLCEELTRVIRAGTWVKVPARDFPARAAADRAKTGPEQPNGTATREEV
jgi:transcriptional regulator with XRE-family HTH domain